MRVTERGVLAVVVGISAVITVVAAFVAGVLTGYSFPGDVWLTAIGWVVPALLILRTDPRHAVGRILLWAGAIWAVYGSIGQVLDALRYDLDSASPVVAAIGNQAYLIGVYMLIAAMGRFPDGRWASRWVGIAFWALVAGGFVSATRSATDPSVGDLYEGPTELPFWTSIPDWVFSLYQGVQTAAVAVFVAGVVWSMVRDMRADPVKRRQYAWVFLGLFAFFGAAVIPALADALGTTMLIVFPLALMLAITRYRLYEIDRIVSRTVTYAVVIGVLVAVYFGLVVVLRSLVPVEGPLPVALSTLAVAFAFFPLARRVQGWVDRRFFRSRYDAASVVSSFADELRGTIEVDAVVGRAEAVVAGVFAPESVGVWLAEEGS